jgi:hypothetical protein
VASVPFRTSHKSSFTQRHISILLLTCELIVRQYLPMQLIDQPGIYSLPEKVYHADPVTMPSLSRSIAKLLIEASPAHAYCAHPRLGAAPSEDETDEVPTAKAVEQRDVGTAAHAAFLRGENVVARIPFDSYQSKVAKAARDEALAAGLVPLKQAKHDEMLRLVEALERYRARTGAFTKGKPEQTIVWQEGPTWCRCQVDWLEDDASAPLWDLKTTGSRASVDQWTRRCFEQGSHLQPIFYARGAAEVRDGECPSGFNFVVMEAFPPYAVRKFELSPVAHGVAAEQIDYAMKLWERCMAENSWPGYPDDTEWLDPPTWVLRQWEWSGARGANAARIAPPPRPIDPAFVDRMIETGNFGG